MKEDEESWRLWALGIIHHALGHAAESDESLRMLTEKYADGGSFQVAEVHAVRGEKDAAFQWLESAYSQRDTGLIQTRSSVHFRSLYGDARWATFLKTMGLGD